MLERRFNNAVDVNVGNDSTVYDPPLQMIHVGTQGNVSVITKNNQTVTLRKVVGWVPIVCRRVRATNTTATDISGYW